MRPMTLLAPLLGTVLATVLIFPAGMAEALQIQAEISAPKEAQVGHEIEIQVALRGMDDGAPIADSQVTLLGQGSFAGVTGEVELARTVTNQDGVALLRYEPRAAGELDLKVQYTLADGAAPETTSFSILAAEGPQTERATSGIQVPGLNVWLLIALISTVWAILFAAALLIVQIARSGAEVVLTNPGGSGPTRSRKEPPA